MKWRWRTMLCFFVLLSIRAYGTSGQHVDYSHDYYQESQETDNACALQYQFTGYNFIEVCCNVQEIWAARLERYTTNYQFTEILPWRSINRLALKNDTTPFCPSDVCQTPSVTLALDKEQKFKPLTWYTVCFKLNNSCPYTCSLVRTCDCNCTENAWFRRSLRQRMPKPPNDISYEASYKFTDQWPIAMQAVSSLWYTTAYYEKCKHVVDSWVDDELRVKQGAVVDRMTCKPNATLKIGVTAHGQAGSVEDRTQYITYGTNAYYVSGVILDVENIRKYLSNYFEEHPVNMVDYVVAKFDDVEFKLNGPGTHFGDHTQRLPTRQIATRGIFDADNVQHKCERIKKGMENNKNLSAQKNMIQQYVVYFLVLMNMGLLYMFM